MSSLYEELTPREFIVRLSECPVAYLPLGTLEWHGPHNPLGADGIQSELFFKEFAEEYGGIVLPKLFVGPDRRKVLDDGDELYGIDYSNGDQPVIEYEDQHMSGSAYYLEKDSFMNLLFEIAKQLKRAGFKVIVAHGHGPSCLAFNELRKKIETELGLMTISLFDFDIDDSLKFQYDHAAANETSIMMALRNDLVHLEYTNDEKMIAVYGKDPRQYANIEFGRKIININKVYLKKEIEKKLNLL